MTIDDDGKMIETPADDQFLIFPPQGVRPWGGRQVVRLQWVGNPDLAASEAFYVSVEQLPVALEPGETETVAAQVQILYNMRALVVVAPPGAKPDVTVGSARQVNYQLPEAPGSDAPPPLQDAVGVVLRHQGQRTATVETLAGHRGGRDR